MGYGGLSDTARHYIGGLLAHAPSLLAFTNPTVNSYRRLVPGFEAPVNLVYSQRNRSACIRIPITGSNPKAKRIEFRVPDPSANPYLAFAAMMLAGIDGIKNKIEPPEPVDKDLYELPPEERADIPQVPGSLPEVLAALENDHEYLLEGGVFTQDLIETWIDWKRENEVASDPATSDATRVRALLRHLSSLTSRSGKRRVGPAPDLYGSALRPGWHPPVWRRSAGVELRARQCAFGQGDEIQDLACNVSLRAPLDGLRGEDLCLA